MGDLKAKADTEKWPLVVARGVEAWLRFPTPETTPTPIKTRPLCLGTMRSVEQSLYIDDLMMESGRGHPFKVTLGEESGVWEGCINTLWEG